MHNAGLDEAIRENARDRVGKTLQAIDDRDQNVLGATAFQLVHDPQPELCPLRLLDPKA